jgi:NAD-dependent DNA ligase
MNKFNGKIFVISGKHPYLTHVQIIRMIRQNGGKVKSNFTKDVNYLVTTLEDF